MTEEQYIEVIKQGTLLSSIPYEKRTLQICIEAVKMGAPLYLVPEELLESDSWLSELHLQGTREDYFRLYEDIIDRMEQLK